MVYFWLEFQGQGKKGYYDNIKLRDEERESNVKLLYTPTIGTVIINRIIHI